MSQRGMELFWGTLRWVMGAVIVAAFVLLIFSVLLWATGLPEEYAPIYAMLSCGAGCVICGLGGGKLVGKRGLAWGMVYAILFLLVFFSALFGINGGILFPSVVRPGILLCILAAGLAGAIGVNLRKE